MTRGEGLAVFLFTILLLTTKIATVSAAAVTGRTFRVFHNTLDPAVFGTAGGAHLVNATGSGFVDALTICVRFQVQRSMLMS